MGHQQRQKYISDFIQKMPLLYGLTHARSLIIHNTFTSISRKTTNQVRMTWLPR